MKRIFSLIFFFLLVHPIFSFHFSYRTSPDLDGALDSYLASLTPAQRLSLLFLVNIEGASSYSSVESYVYEDGTSERLVPGGCLFFSYNLSEKPEEIIAFTESIEEFCKKNNIPQPYLALDQEGGYVNRLSEISSPLPSNQRVSEKLTPSQAYSLYKFQAEQASALGFTMNLAPVAEVSGSWNQDMLQTRSYGSVAETESFSIACVSAWQSCGIGAVVKHFPGNTNTDPHTGLPELNFSQDELNNHALVPFFIILQAEPSAVLMSHARIALSDASSPACLSSYWVDEYLIHNMNFKGLVISDDIFMAALEKNGFPPQTAAVQAIKAGVDVIMLSEKKFADVARVLSDKAKEDLEFEKSLVRAQKKVLLFKIQCGILSAKKTEDGSIVIEENSLKSRLGSSTVRLEKFRKAKSSGLTFYRDNLRVLGKEKKGEGTK